MKNSKFKTAAVGLLPLLLILVVVACQTAADKSDSTDKTDKPKQTDTANSESASATKAVYEKRWEERPFEAISNSCFNCHETLARQHGRPARDHITSAHFRATVSCQECHGGDPTKDDSEEAHNKEMGYIGKMTSDDMNERCGKCHTHEVATFKASKHFPDHEGVDKVTCMLCHGSHDIGARPESFKWTANCAQCHATGKSPVLPAEIIAMTDSKDALHDALRQLRYKLTNKPFPKEIMDPYREVRQITADIVHATKAKEIKESLDLFQAKNAALTEKIKAATTN